MSTHFPRATYSGSPMPSFESLQRADAIFRRLILFVKERFTSSFPSVIVPVLSEAIIVALPSVSTAGR